MEYSWVTVFYFYTKTCESLVIHFCIHSEVGVRLFCSGQTDNADNVFPAKLRHHLNLHHAIVLSCLFLDSLWMFSWSQGHAAWMTVHFAICSGRCHLAVQESWPQRLLRTVHMTWLSTDSQLAAWGRRCRTQHLVWRMELRVAISVMVESHALGWEERKEMKLCDCDLKEFCHLISCNWQGSFPTMAMCWWTLSPTLSCMEALSEGICPPCLVPLGAPWVGSGLGPPCVRSARPWWRRGTSFPFHLCQLGCVTSPFHTLGPVNWDVGLIPHSGPCKQGHEADFWFRLLPAWSLWVSGERQGGCELPWLSWLRWRVYHFLSRTSGTWLNLSSFCALRSQDTAGPFLLGQD